MIKNKRCISYPKVDGSLYRYRSLGNDKRELDRLLDEIKTGNIHLSRIYNLNDPFETRYIPQSLDNIKCNYHILLQIVVKISKKEYLYSTIGEEIKGEISDGSKIVFNDFIKLSFRRFKKAYQITHPKTKVNLKQYKEMIIKEYQKMLPSDLKDYLIASFSETYKSIPMWAYYANGYQGVCLEYGFARIKSSNNYILKNIYKVSYSSQMPNNKFKFDYSATIKSIEWSHEQEWRLILPFDSDKLVYDNNHYFINVPYLKRVIFGTYINPFHALEIEKVVKKINKKERKNKIYIEMIKPKCKKYELSKDKNIRYSI